VTCVCGHPADSHFDLTGRCNGRSYDIEYPRAWNCLCATFDDGTDTTDALTKLPMLHVPAVNWSDADAEFHSDMTYMKELVDAIIDIFIAPRMVW